MRFRFCADSDASPYDSGSYASSTAYVTGKAVERACMELRQNMCAIASQILNCPAQELIFDANGVMTPDGQHRVSRQDIAQRSMGGCGIPAQTTVSHTSPVSPLPLWLAWWKLNWIDRPVRWRS